MQFRLWYNISIRVLNILAKTFEQYHAPFAFAGKENYMIRSFKEMEEVVLKGSKKVVAVACAHDEHTLEAVLHANKKGILDYLLFGRKHDILEKGKALGVEIDPSLITHCEDDMMAAQWAVRAVKEKKADFILKGIMQTSTLLREVVNKDRGIGLGKPMSHVALIDAPNCDRLLGVTDGVMLIKPDYEQKKAIIKNAMQIYDKLGISSPKVAGLCAVEVVNPKMPETIDADKLTQDGKNGEFGSAIVEGPMAIDLALIPEASKIKGYKGEIQGDADILLTHDIACGNVLAKALVAVAGAKYAGCILGAICPISLNSRSASFEEKYYSLVLCTLMLQ